MNPLLPLIPPSLSKAETLQIRFWFFLLGCIGTRSACTAVAAYAPCSWLRILGALALILVARWFYLIFVGRRDTGIEVLGDRIWWVGLRPIHMLLWAFFAYLALGLCHPMAWVVLAVDTIFGLLSFLVYHGRVGNLRIMLGGA